MSFPSSGLKKWSRQRENRISCSAYSSVLKMVQTRSSETWPHFQRTTRRYFSETVHVCKSPQVEKRRILQLCVPAACFSDLSEKLPHQHGSPTYVHCTADHLEESQRLSLLRNNFGEVVKHRAGFYSRDSRVETQSNNCYTDWAFFFASSVSQRYIE